uniref:Uncharacterized protein n=1 Tax=Opuntia streptacantha TaxID=393608 RepID=A0A7C9A1E4_OPUST
MATSLPSCRNPLYTQPNPPAPMMFFESNPSVADANSSYVNHVFELPIPSGDAPLGLGFTWNEEPVSGVEANAEGTMYIELYSFLLRLRTKKMASMKPVRRTAATVPRAIPIRAA